MAKKIKNQTGKVTSDHKKVCKKKNDVTNKRSY